ncbi:ABC transporter substrate-binding protein [Amphibiibacter pelophylacis]|uniref:ABC transporter substrate-binding protein n=1 Tax=Amphibiibacter pelophylacis TaxID=1799477 RepID=A0ACC6P0P9_9BURK
MPTRHTPSRRLKRLTVALTALAALTAAPVHAAEKITLMVGGINYIIYLPAMLTQQLGYFREEGLDVTLLSQPSGSSAENELLAGSVQGVVGFYDHCVDLQAKGKALQSVVQLGSAPGTVLLVSQKSPDITRAAALKGQTLGVTGLGSSSDFLTQYTAIKAGLKPGDFSVLPVGGGQTFIAAMQQGRIAAGMTIDPTATEMVRTGQARVLVDMRTESGARQALGGAYPAASLYLSADWIKTHGSEVQKLTRAFVRTLQFIHTHSAEQIADRMPADYYGGDKARYVEALKASLGTFSANGLMPADGPATVLQVLSAFKPQVKAAHIDLSRTYTTAYVQAALKSRPESH